MTIDIQKQAAEQLELCVPHEQLAIAMAALGHRVCSEDLILVCAHCGAGATVRDNKIEKINGLFIPVKSEGKRMKFDVFSDFALTGNTDWNQPCPK